jgi:hypothetical protein
MSNKRQLRYRCAAQARSHLLTRVQQQHPSISASNHPQFNWSHLFLGLFFILLYINKKTPGVNSMIVTFHRAKGLWPLQVNALPGLPG